MSAVEQMNRIHKKLGSSPLISFLLGALSLLLWTCATVVQIQTSEYLAQGGVRQVTGIAYNILLQPWLMITGQAPLAFVTSWIYGWTLELITLVFALTLSAAVVKISSANPHLGRWFVPVGIFLIVMNGWADYSSSPGGNILIQGLIALVVGGIVVVGLPLGAGLVEHALEEL